MVATIIALVVFFVLIEFESINEHLHAMAIRVASLTELSLYSLTTVAVLIGMLQVTHQSTLYYRTFYLKRI